MSDRDTHFSGFAKLLMEQMLSEINVEIVTSFGWREDWEIIIAQRAYDFACHVAMQNTLVAHHDMGKIPDLIEWPKPETNE